VPPERKSEGTPHGTPRSTPYGSWSSPLDAERIATGGLRLAEPRIDQGTVYWLEGRPSESGRTVLMRSSRDSEIEECVGPDVDVRSRAHEYGGGAYLVQGGRTFVVDDAGGRLVEPRRGALGRADARYADLALSLDERWLIAVEEVAGEGPGGEPANRLVALGLAGDASGERLVVADGFDFVSFPTFSPDGCELAFTSWMHPNMPWDESSLFVVGWGPAGPRGAPRHVAGGAGESIFQPRYGPDGHLFFVSDRSGWWNLYVQEGAAARPLCPMSAEFGAAQWAFGLSRYDFVDAETILCAFDRAGQAALGLLDIASGELRSIRLDLASIEGVRVEDGLACFLGASATQASCVFAFEIGPRRLHVLRPGLTGAPEPALISQPEAIEFPTQAGRTAHAFFYPPHAPGVVGPETERPPLLVKSHGGPTGVAHGVLDLRVQYWTSRGFAVVDVNYAGSTTFGRAYRERLDGQWGVADVEDCIAAARFLARGGRVDGERMLISGGSAGGYTTLCALTFHDVFRAGASHYGIGDLEALARDTHKFESRYTDRLVAPYPDGIDVYRARSPIHHVDRLTCPVIFFQGVEDRVVPPNQAKAMVDALARRGIPHAYVEFEGEGHGFRRAENIQAALEGELFFYSRILGFEVDVLPPEVELIGGRPPRA